MPKSFQFTSVSHDLLRNFAQILIEGDSLVLLGPRYSGKRWIVRQLATMLRSKSGEFVLQVDLTSDFQISDEAIRQNL
jgi:ABC-type iron transport system FetAB ATPase subunit